MDYLKSSSMYVFLSDYIPGNGNAGCRYFSLSRNCHTFFSKCLYQSTLPAIVYVSSNCSISLPTLDVVSLFNFSHFGGCVVGSHCVCVCVHMCMFLLFWDNWRFTCSCKKEYKEIPYILSFSPNGNILCHYSTISQPGNWHFISFTCVCVV